MNPSSPPSIPLPSPPLISMADLASTAAAASAANDDASLPFEWTDLFDFSLDDDNSLLFPLDSSLPLPPSPPIPIQEPEPEPERTDRRVRKRDPRLVCENYLAGRIPCACPEMDAAMEAVEDGEGGGSGKKRVRRGRREGEGGRGGGVVRCQVPGCEVDIRELKGYHRRHRVCLRCANAAEVVIGGEEKRYCQQCGKFHILSDFDEDKRSCRRKLERHNNRRRRKSMSRGSTQNEAPGDLLFEDVSSDGEAGRVNVCSTSQITEDDEREPSLDQKNGDVSNICSALDSQNMQRSSVVSFEASRETASDRGKDDSNYDLSPSYCNNKSTYSSMCPTGRISFKLYDWNPAEFPRRLRHQIFQWLARMPVELEGYIRPGCTILTAFISMPQFAWTKLLDDPVSCLRDVLAPGRMLCGRGTAFVYLNNRIFGVLKDGTSVVNIDVAMRAPKLHYVYPSCFEAGKPMEFVACGSNLLQSKFRSLVSFSGKYLPHDYHVVFPHGKDTIGAPPTFDNQQLRINVPYTAPECFGPAFIEVENESGLSNFLPILIADEEVCSEVLTLHQKSDASLLNKSQLEADIPYRMGQMGLSDLILDLAWLLKEPHVEEIQRTSTFMQLQRYNYLLNFLIRNKSICILERLHERLSNLLAEKGSGGVTDGVNDADMLLFQKHMAQAKQLVLQKFKVEDVLPKSNSAPIGFAGTEVLSTSSAYNQDIEWEAQHQNKHCTMLLGHSSPQRKDETDPLLNSEVPAKFQNASTRDSCNPMVAKKIINSRSLVYLFAAAVVCCGVCAVLLHPNRGHSFVVTIRRCLFDGSF
ncbi:Squamosa promoter-binding-like protein [Drosera capensis]